MKKLFIAAALLLSSSAIFAQTKFGIKGGVNFANMTLKEDGSSATYSPSSQTSFHITGLADIKVNETFSFQPGLSLSGKGFSNKYSTDYSFVGFDYSASYENHTNVYYLEIPLNAVAKLQAGSGKFLIGAGPYTSFGLSGKTKTKTTGTDEEGNNVNETENEDIEFGSGEEQMKRFDFGLNFLAGYELQNGVSLNAGYGLGLNNLANSNEGSVKNKVFSISVGFLF